ncbi:ACP S-malonyltransferase [Pseudactinotalea sp. Z1748]|uniref:ACP S-malonyltransferase n=1 Tax=Pseudactinotalea sp. Z1748 TaxID=3413027 RepID=UPI003C7E504B
MIALLCPGQGAQKPGMLTPWVQTEATADLLAEFSTTSNVDLATLGSTADAETIKDTALAQPLIVAASLLALDRLTQALGPVAQWADAVAGHSVGEFTAVAAAGVLEPAEAVRLVATRGRAMAEAAAQRPTGMAAVVGGTPEDVSTALAGAGLVGANINGGGQVVAAGTTEAITKLQQSPPAGARVIPLAVAGAFHTEHMAGATAPVGAAIDGLRPEDPEITLLSNADGQPVTEGRDALARLVTQITAPVRWDLCQGYLREAGVRLVIELAPGGVLTGLARRTLPGVQTVAIKTPDDIEAAVAAVQSVKESR